MVTTVASALAPARAASALHGDADVRRLSAAVAARTCTTGGRTSSRAGQYRRFNQPIDLLNAHPLKHERMKVSK